MFFDMSDKQSLTTKVYNHIRDGILDGSYKIGDYLVETRLVGAYNFPNAMAAVAAGIMIYHFS